jgi:hypothetical protein
MALFSSAKQRIKGLEGFRALGRQFWDVRENIACGLFFFFVRLCLYP